MNYKPGDILGGKYRIQELLGGGSMGKLYKAEHINIHKPVAIKFMNGDFAKNDEYQQRFMREAQAAASLEHLNICTIIDYEMLEDGDAYIVMELLSGETLSTRIERVGTLSPLSACIIMRELLSALGCAHAKGIVHRDVKPDNIFLVKYNDRDDFVKLIDFGVAHIEHPESEDVKKLTQSGQVYGTPQYLSPEQANSEPIDYRADLYAAGAIFYEMLVGEPPFDGKSCLELLIKQVKEPAPHLPDTIARHEHLDAMIQRLLQKKPADRYQSAADAIADLDKIIILFTASTPMSASISILSGAISKPELAQLPSSSAERSNELNVHQKETVPGKKISLNTENKEDADSSAADSTSPPKDTQPQADKSNGKKLIVTLAVILAVLLIGVTTALILGKPEPVPTAEITDPISYPQATEEIVQSLDEVEENSPKPAPYNIVDESFGIASDEVLSSDTQMFLASESYLSKKYDIAFNTLEKLKKKYWAHPNFVRAYFLSSAALQKTNQEYEAFAHLLAIEPLAGFNPSVKNLAYELFDDDNTATKLGNVIVKAQGTHSKTAMAWLIIHSKYDCHEKLRHNMIDVYDRLNNVHSTEDGKITEMPAWMIKSVNVWRLSKKECTRRLTLLTQLEQMDESKDEVYQNILLPFYNQRSKECTVRRGSADCNSCLRTWLDDVISKYEESQAHAESE